MANIVIIWMRCTWKTTSWKALAKYLGLDFIDTDEMIVDDYGDSVSNMVKQ